MIPSLYSSDPKLRDFARQLSYFCGAFSSAVISRLEGRVSFERNPDYLKAAVEVLHEGQLYTTCQSWSWKDLEFHCKRWPAPNGERFAADLCRRLVQLAGMEKAS